MTLDAVLELLQVPGSHLTRILGSKFESYRTATSAPNYQTIYQAPLAFLFQRHSLCVSFLFLIFGQNNG